MNISIINNPTQIIIAVLMVLFVLANAVSPLFGWLAIVVLLAFVIWNDKTENLYISFFLIPNIRILDSLGSTIYVNLLLMAIGFLYILFNMTVSRNGLLFVLAIAVFSMIHLFESTYSLDNIIPLLNLIFDALLVAVLIYIRPNKLQCTRAAVYLSVGAVFSLISFCLIHREVINEVLQTNYRLAGYGDDPNYFSIYVLIGISFALSALPKSSGKSMILLYVALLTILGLLTSSKMYFLCLAFMFLLYVYDTVINSRVRKTAPLLIVLFSILLAGLFQIDSVSALFSKVIGRFTDINSSANLFDIDSITTGRITLIREYCAAAVQDPFSLLLGRGINYPLYYSDIIGDYRVVHNTYLDMLLSWGLIGTATILYFLFRLMRGCLVFKGKNLTDGIPAIIFFTTLLSLSCLTADMFLYILLLVLLPFKKGEHEVTNESFS